jgi:ATP-dependent Zn protease
MITYYGMGKSLIYPSNSEKYKAMVDDEVSALIQEAYVAAEHIVRSSKDFILETSELLKRDNIIYADYLERLLRCKYKHLNTLVM